MLAYKFGYFKARRKKKRLSSQWERATGDACICRRLTLFLLGAGLSTEGLVGGNIRGGYLEDIPLYILWLYMQPQEKKQIIVLLSVCRTSGGK